MMKVFLDTNILLDYGEVRDDFIYAKAIMELGERGDVELFASYLSYANMGYILRHYPKEELWPLKRICARVLMFFRLTAISLTKPLPTAR